MKQGIRALRKAYDDDRQYFKWLSERTLRIAWRECANEDGYHLPYHHLLKLTSSERIIRELARPDCFADFKRTAVEKIINELTDTIPAQGLHAIPEDLKGWEEEDILVDDDGNISCRTLNTRESVLAGLESIEVFFGCGLSDIEMDVLRMWVQFDETTELLFRKPKLSMQPGYVDQSLSFAVSEVSVDIEQTKWIIHNVQHSWTIAKRTPRTICDDSHYQFSDQSEAALFKLIHHHD